MVADKAYPRSIWQWIPVEDLPAFKRRCKGDEGGIFFRHKDHIQSQIVYAKKGGISLLAFWGGGVALVRGTRWFA
jgi:hypothetical protein